MKTKRQVTNLILGYALMLTGIAGAHEQKIDWSVLPCEVARLYLTGETNKAIQVLNTYMDDIKKAKENIRLKSDGFTSVENTFAQLRFLIAYTMWSEAVGETKANQPDEERIKSLLFGLKSNGKRDGTGAYNHAINVLIKYSSSDVAIASGKLCKQIEELIYKRYGRKMKSVVTTKQMDSAKSITKETEEPIDAVNRLANRKVNMEQFVNEVECERARLKLERRKTLKAIADVLVQKAHSYARTTFELKGFYLGMPITDAKKLVEYYLPDAPIEITKDNNLAIDKPEELFDSTLYWMYFCQADKSGRVYRFNFDKRFLKKWCRYDVQTHEEWAEAFGREHGCDFRYNKIEKNRDMGAILPLTVKQDSYRYLNNLKDYKITYFGKKEVFDPTNGQAADAGDVGFAAGAGGFAGGMPDNFQIQAEAMRLTGQRIGVHSWIQHGYENGDGAKEGTLRVEVLKD